MVTVVLARPAFPFRRPHPAPTNSSRVRKSRSGAGCGRNRCRRRANRRGNTCRIPNRYALGRTGHRGISCSCGASWAAKKPAHHAAGRYHCRLTQACYAAARRKSLTQSKNLSAQPITCRPGCGACCTAPSITSPIPGMPQGKGPGIRCVQLTDDNQCLLFGRPERPTFCVGLQPSAEMCGADREQAIRWLETLDRVTTPT